MAQDCCFHCLKETSKENYPNLGIIADGSRFYIEPKDYAKCPACGKYYTLKNCGIAQNSIQQRFQSQEYRKIEHLGD